MYTNASTSEALLSEFPELRDELTDNAGLLHLQLAVLARHTQDAIAAGDLATVRRDFMFVDRVLAAADKFVRNAVHVSYLEHVEFTGTHGAAARDLLSSRLREGWHSIHRYMETLAEAAAADPRRNPAARGRRKRR